MKSTRGPDGRSTASRPLPATVRGVRRLEDDELLDDVIRILDAARRLLAHVARRAARR